MTQNNINNTASTFTVGNINFDTNTISSTDTNGNINIYPDGTGNIVVDSSALMSDGDREDDLGSTSLAWNDVFCDGLTFDDGTNVLSTYLQATSWTPLLVGTTSAGVGTYTYQVGRYIRIGNTVFLTFNLKMTSHTGSGKWDLGNLPLAPVSTDNSFGCCIMYDGGGYPAGLQQLGIRVNGDPTYLYIGGYKSGGSIDKLGSGNFTSGSIAGSLVYLTS